MSESRRSMIRPRNIVIALIAVVVLAIGGYATYLANLGGYLPWQEDPTPISRDITPFAGTGFENLPTVPPKRQATPTPADASTPAAVQGDTLSSAQTIVAQPTVPECDVCD